MSRRAALAVLGAMAVVAAACSAPVDSGPKTIRAASLPPALRAEPPSTTTTTAPTTESEEVNVYFIQGDRLYPVKRRVSPPATVEKVLKKLFAAPTAAESVFGLRTAISIDTTILGAPIENGIATVNVSKDFAFGLPTDQILAIAQVVFTALDVEGVTGVLFAQNGRRLEVPQGDGSFTSTPLGRASFSEVTPR